jgi:16S rRNA (cytosine967-C5)-methyltransferase
LKPKNPRAICLEILTRTGRRGEHLDDLLNDAFKRYRHLTPVDRSFLTELAYGTLRWRERLDWVIRCFSKTAFEKIEPEILHILRIAIYQVLFLTRTPVSAAVNEAVELATRFRGKGGGGFVNALLRSFLREPERAALPGLSGDPVQHVSVSYSHPVWLVKRWLGEMGLDRTIELCEENNRIPSLILRTNTLKASREALIERLRERGLHPEPTACSDAGIRLEEPPPVSELPLLREGWYVIQDEASQLVTGLLAPLPGERILDGCSAPGGKATDMAERMSGQGEIFAVDVSREKLARVEEACSRLGIRSVRTVKADASRPLPPPVQGPFDRILADVPCSGFGTLRKHPDLKWRRGPDDISRLAGLQKAILGNLSAYLKPGGALVYSTCTVFREENEDVVESFLAGHPDFRLDPAEPFLAGRCLGLTEKGYLKTFPASAGMSGFFAARLVKTERGM